MKLIEQYLREAIIFNRKDLLYRLDEWIESKNGLLFVTGYTGSGKTTTAKKLAKKHNAEYIELDSAIGDIAFKYKDELNRLAEENPNKAKLLYQKITDDYFNTLLKKKFNKPTVIEGINIFLYAKPLRFKKHSIIVIGTSALVSMYRAYKRNIQDKDYLEREGRWGILIDIRWNLFIKKIEAFRKIVKNFK